MKRTFLLLSAVVLLGSCDLFMGPEGPIGMLSGNRVSGILDFSSSQIPPGGADIWIVTLDNDLDAGNGVVAVVSGIVLPGTSVYSFVLDNVPPGSYYLFAFNDQDGTDRQFSNFPSDKTGQSPNDWGYSGPESCAFYGVFDRATIEAGGFWSSTTPIHTAAPNVAAPATGELDLGRIYLYATMPV